MPIQSLPSPVWRGLVSAGYSVMQLAPAALLDTWTPPSHGKPNLHHHVPTRGCVYNMRLQPLRSGCKEPLRIARTDSAGLNMTRHRS